MTTYVAYAYTCLLKQCIEEAHSVSTHCSYPVKYKNKICIDRSVPNRSYIIHIHIRLVPCSFMYNVKFNNFNLVSFHDHEDIL